MAWLAGAIQAGTGLYQTIKSNQALNELNKQPEPGYTVSPELNNAYGRAESMAGQGYTGAEKAAFGQNLAQQTNTGYNNAISYSGGNLAQALSNGLQSNKIGAINDFAASDAGLHRSNIHYADSLAQELQNQSNLINQNKIQRYNMLQQAYGGGLKTGISNLMGGGMTAGYSLAANNGTPNDGNPNPTVNTNVNSKTTPINLTGYTNVSGNWLNPTKY